VTSKQLAIQIIGIGIPGSRPGSGAG